MASDRHDAIVAALGRLLTVSFRRTGRRCDALHAQRVATAGVLALVTPDCTVVRDKAQFARGFQDALLNPCALFEVFSRGTEARDRGERFKLYRDGIPSLVDYLLVSDRQPLIEHWQLMSYGWTLIDEAGPGATLTLDCGGVLQVDDVYRDVWDLPGDER